MRYFFYDLYCSEWDLDYRYLFDVFCKKGWPEKDAEELTMFELGPKISERHFEAFCRVEEVCV